MVARASHRSKLAVCDPRSSASRSTLEWRRWRRRRYTWLALVPRARCEPRQGNVRQVATDAHRGRASPAKTVFIFVAHLPQYNNCAQPDQNSGDENYHNFFWSSLSPHQPNSGERRVYAPFPERTVFDARDAVVYQKSQCSLDVSKTYVDVVWKRRFSYRRDEAFVRRPVERVQHVGEKQLRCGTASNEYRFA